MLHRITALSAALALGLAAAVPGGAALAQSVGGFEENRIEAFAEAAVAIQEINADYARRMEAAESMDDQQALAEQANARAVAVLDENDTLDVEGYNEIARAAQEDPEVAQRINDEIASLMQ